MEVVCSDAQTLGIKMKQNVTWDEIYKRLNKLPEYNSYYGIPRGGQVVAGLTGRAVSNIEDAECIIDDIYDRGDTAKKYKKYNKPM